MSLILTSCIEENPNLVNPPDKTASIKFRFLNLGYDKKTKEFGISEGKKTQSILWKQISSTDNPPADTGYVGTYYNGIAEYEQTQLVRFLRNTNYTYIGLSSNVCPDRANCGIDTLIALRTTSAIPENNFEALLKFMNAYPDTNSRFSIRLGCPSGNVLFGATNYKQYSINPITVRTGQFNFSVIKTEINNGLPENVYLNLYTTQINPKGQYIIIVHEDENGEPFVSIIDENDETTNSFKPAEIVPLRTTEIRTINFSSSELFVQMRNGDVINPNIQSMNVDEYRTIETCKSSLLDTLDILSVGEIKSSISTSLEVLSRYSLLVFDSAGAKAAGSLLIEPLKLNVETNAKSIIRVVNTLDENNSINVSIGARKENDRALFPNGYSSGISLGRQLSFGEISLPVVVNPGAAPISVFTSKEPSSLLFAANTILEPDKSYLIVVAKDVNDNIKLSLIDEDDESKNIEFLKQGVFFQLVNATADNSTLRVSINSLNAGSAILEDADLFISNSLATVIDENSQSIILNGISYEANADVNQRVLMIVGGTGSNLDVMTDKFAPLSQDQNKIFRLRFANITSDLPVTYLKKSNKDSVIAESVERQLFSSYIIETREQKPTYFFYENESDSTNYLTRFSDVVLSLGKSYCVIIYGNSNRKCQKKYDAKNYLDPNCYSIIIQQEF
jgi:hypothetical protein